jgi:hypothetical protein
MEIQKVSDTFGWLGGTLKINGTGFGTAADNYVGLRIGSKVVELKTLQWTEKELRVQVPASAPSRTYDLGIFKKPAQAPAPLSPEKRLAIKLPKIPSDPPAPAPLPPTVLIRNIMIEVPALSNTIKIFIALGPPPEDKKTSPESDYFAQVNGFGKMHECEPEWYTYMANASMANPLIPAMKTYLEGFNAYKAFTKHTYLLSYEYEFPPIKPFESETTHMKLLTEYLTLSFPGPIYNFKIVFGKIPETAFQQPVIPIKAHVNNGNYGGLYNDQNNTLNLGNDGILIHEFAHSRGAQHHYGNQGNFLLAYGEEKCVMWRNSNGFCRGCSVALGLAWPLKKEASDRIDQLTLELNSHFNKVAFPSP